MELFLFLKKVHHLLVALIVQHPTYKRLNTLWDKDKWLCNYLKWFNLSTNMCLSCFWLSWTQKKFLLADIFCDQAFFFLYVLLNDWIDYSSTMYYCSVWIRSLRDPEMMMRLLSRPFGQVWFFCFVLLYVLHLLQMCSSLGEALLASC